MPCTMGASSLPCTLTPVAFVVVIRVLSQDA